MIIKGEEGKGTGNLESFGVAYGNSSVGESTISYREENGEYHEIVETTKEENIRYEPFSPFLARYFFIVGVYPKSVRGYYALQIDVLGCIIKGPPCSDIINTIPGEIISAYDDIDDDCFNEKHLEIKFVESGIYKITSDNDVYKLIDYDEKYKIIYNYDSKYEEEISNFKKVGPSGIFGQIETPVQSLKLCMHSNIYEYRYLYNYDGSDIYKYIVIEVRGCRIRYLPTSSNIE